jgi:chaperonin cofactor prefoldin
VTPETVVYLLIAGGIGILFKIVWDWLVGLKRPNGIKEVCKQRMDTLDDDICRLYERLEKIEGKLEATLEKINRKIDEKFELLIKMLTQDRS